jgi:hypothetical protein
MDNDHIHPAPVAVKSVVIALTNLMDAQLALAGLPVDRA